MTELRRGEAHDGGRDFVLPATLTERFFGRFSLMGQHFQIYLEVALKGQLDRGALSLALERTIADHPRLLVRLTPTATGFSRRIESPAAIHGDRLIRYHASPEELERSRADGVDLETTGPIRLEVLETGDQLRLIIVAHHAMTDASGVLTIYDRLGQRYSEATGGPAPEPVPAPGDPRRRRLLDGKPLSLKRAALGAVLSPVREMIPGQRPVPAAKFFNASAVDAPGTLHTQHLTVEPALLNPLLRSAARRAASLNDLLVAAVTVAALEEWPQADDVPIGLDIPVDLRDSPGDVADRAAPFRFGVPSVTARDFDATLGLVCQRTREARGRTPSIVQSFGSTIPSYLPPTIFKGMVGGFLRENPTGGDSICISNVGAFGGRLRDPGSLTLEDVRMYASAAGLRLTVIPSPGGLSLSFSYFAPLIADEQVQRIVQRVGERLREFAAGRARISGQAGDLAGASK